MAWEILKFKPAAWNVDVSQSSLPDNAVNSLTSMDFFGGVARSLNRMVSYATPSTAPLTISSYSDDSSTYAGYAGASGTYAWGSTGQINTTPTTGLTGHTYWDSTAFGKWFVATNGKYPEVPHAISSSSTGTAGKMAPLPGWIANASTNLIRTHRNLLWAANLTESGIRYPTRVRWSTSAVTNALPSSWVVTAANDAGMVDLQFTGGQIVDMCGVGDVMYIGAPGGIWAARWVGGQYVYNFSQINGLQGPRAIRCMESMGDAGVVLTVNDLLVFDETSEFSISTGVVSTLIRQFTKAEILYVASVRQLYILYSLSGEDGYQHCLIWDRDSNTFGQRNLGITATASGAMIIPEQQVPLTWDTYPGTWDEAVNPWQTAQTIYFNYSAANGDGFYFSSNHPTDWLISRSKMPSVGNDVIRVRSIEPDIDGPSQPVWMRIGASDSLGEPIRWEQEKQFTVGDTVRNDTIAEGRYISWQVRGYGPVKLNGITLYYEPRGRKP